jgi:hypothetical protein
MLSSIHPLGERARNNTWLVTVTAFTIGAVAGGAALGGILGLAGGEIALRVDLALIVIGALAVAAGGLDLAGVKTIGPRRQVNERWIGALRGTVYGAGFGAQLGTGIATFIVTWGVWVVWIAAFLSGSVLTGVLIGSVFGFGRAIAPLAAGWIDRPSRLTAFHERMATLAAPAHVGMAAALALVGVVAFVQGV